MPILEAPIEQRFVDLVQSSGLPVAIIKLNLQGRTGWPDRLCLLPDGRTLFVEFKRPGEDLRPRQRHVHSILRSLSHDVQTFTDAQKAFEYLVRTVDS